MITGSGSLKDDVTLSMMLIHVQFVLKFINYDKSPPDIVDEDLSWSGSYERICQVFEPDSVLRRCIYYGLTQRQTKDGTGEFNACNYMKLYQYEPQTNNLEDDLSYSAQFTLNREEYSERTVKFLIHLMDHGDKELIPLLGPGELYQLLNLCTYFGVSVLPLNYECNK